MPEIIAWAETSSATTIGISKTQEHNEFSAFHLGCPITQGRAFVSEQSALT
jgi:hypothetical protein